MTTTQILEMEKRESMYRFLGQTMQVQRRTAATEWMALVVFLAALFLGAIVGTFIVSFFNVSLGSITILSYTTSIWGFFVVGIPTFFIYIYLAQKTHAMAR